MAQQQHGSEMRLGQGGRFRALEAHLKEQGVRNPGGLAATLGRRAHGKKMAELAALGRKRAAKERGERE